MAPKALFDFVYQVEDEIALEGLDGITLQGNFNSLSFITVLH